MSETIKEKGAGDLSKTHTKQNLSSCVLWQDSWNTSDEFKDVAHPVRQSQSVEVRRAVEEANKSLAWERGSGENTLTSLIPETKILERTT